MPPRLRTSNLPSSAASSPSIRSQCLFHPIRTSRELSQTSCQQVTARRRKFYEWLNGPGAQLKEPLPGSTNYLGAYDKYGNLVRASPAWQRKSRAELQREKEMKQAEPVVKAEPVKAETEKTEGASEGQEEVDELEMQTRRDEEAKRKETKDDDQQLPPETAEDLRPFPQNRFFRSQPVLSEDLREAIYQRVKRDGATVSLASVEFGVSNERVGAVVRLKQMEKEWIAQGKILAVPYARAVLEMIPVTPFIDTSLPENKGKRPVPHEPINDLIVHPATRQQLFVPVAESRQFTREDAGKAFDNHLLPADDRIPHPELVKAERELAAGLPFEERRRLVEGRLKAEQAKKSKEEARKAAAIASLKTVPQRRWDFVFQDVSVEAVGKKGRDPRGVGWRYGFPHEDRKKGHVKIPTRVDA
ncbi:hypothetical protein P154DRAFT_519619 [Amniculicola lignicola CBS 123094]|uniref:Ribosomal protein S35, mitochondrial n=1 Tax=Amniculicola lignicola CBS 123094 TaxID=1392246 RepID=A0A6A5WV39_9PLEO|nr:hypothetical protein P154DRAFT_519619 [Amniculicola lignicola CBS 123094]